jgi:uncharacterized protein
MDIIRGGQITEVISIGFARGDMFLEGIRHCIRECDIQHGVILSGMGTFDKCRVHYTTFNGLPPVDEFVEIEGALELVNITGHIVDGDPHLHCTVGDMDRTWAAHLEDGCRVLYLAEICIGRLDGMPMTREVKHHGIRELHNTRK